MEQVKVFDGLPGCCEEEINEWLTENANKVNIIRVLQSSATWGTSDSMSSQLHISIFYKNL
jgi:hypothetical protein